MTVAELKAALQNAPDDSPVRVVVGDVGFRLVTWDILTVAINEVNVCLLMPSEQNIQAMTKAVLGERELHA